MVFPFLQQTWKYVRVVEKIDAGVRCVGCKMAETGFKCMGKASSTTIMLSVFFIKIEQEWGVVPNRGGP